MHEFALTFEVHFAATLRLSLRISGGLAVLHLHTSLLLRAHKHSRVCVNCRDQRARRNRPYVVSEAATSKGCCGIGRCERDDRSF